MKAQDEGQEQERKDEKTVLRDQQFLKSCVKKY